MCGSGTFPVEACLLACGIPPGKYRKSFGFQRWNDFNPELFDEVRRECNALVPMKHAAISGSDISGEAVRLARLNVESAGLDHLISIEKHDFRDIQSENREGIIFLNPPYGQRIKTHETETLYKMIGSTLKHNFPGFRAFIISSDTEALKHVGLKPSVKRTLFNGSLKCSLMGYNLYAGSLKR